MAKTIETAALVLLAAGALATRFYALGAKPFHHDESLFAFHAYHLYVAGDYDYSPILHGPFLEDVTALLFWLFGDSDTTARLWAALSGVLLIAVVWLWRGRMGRVAVVCAALLITISPTILYYSRFNRNDVPFTLAAVVFLWLVMRMSLPSGRGDALNATALPSGRGTALYLFLAILAVAWMICIKETYVVFLFICATFLIVVITLRVMQPHAEHEVYVKDEADDETRPHAGRQFRNKRPIIPHLIAAISGVLVGLFLIVLLFTTFFRHMEHWDGPLEAIRYWSGQHAEQRIFGEWHYYIPILLLYEFPPLALVIWGTGRTLRRADWLDRRVAWGWAAASALLLAALWWIEFPKPLAAILHMSRGWHLWVAVQIFTLSAAACVELIRRERRLEAFFLWWAMGAFLAYSYAGEKVPWIAVHIAFPMILSAAMFLQEWLGDGARRSSSAKRAIAGAVLVAGGLAMAFVGIRAAFIHRADPAERLVYTHTTEAYLDMVGEVRELARRTFAGPTASFPIFIQGDSIWPGQWYFRRFNVIHAASPPSDRLPVIIGDQYLDSEHRTTSALSKWPWLTKMHVVRVVPFREWWLQEPLLGTVARLFDIWMALVPKQFRRMPVTDAKGEPVVFFGDRDGLPNMTVGDEVRASKEAWRKIFQYVVFRRDFDPHRSPVRTRDHFSVLFCVRKDLILHSSPPPSLNAARPTAAVQRKIF